MASVRTHLLSLIAGAAVAFYGPNSTFADSTWDTRAFHRPTCPIAGKFISSVEEFGPGVLAGLAQAVLPSLIDRSIDLLATAVEEAGKDKTISRTALLPIESLYIVTKGNLSPAIANTCIVIVRGRFGSSAEASDLQGVGWNSPDAKDFAKQIGLKSDPGIYFEGWLVASPDNSSIRIQPATMDYMMRLDDSRVGQRDNQLRDVFFEFQFQRPGREDSKVFAFAMIPFNEVSRPGSFDSESLNGKSSPWLPLPPSNLDQASLERLEGLHAYPINLEITIREARDGNRFLRELATVLNESKPQLKELLTTNFVGTQRLEAEFQQKKLEADRMTLQLSAMRALHEVQIAQQAVIVLPANASAEEKLKATQTVQTRMLEANIQFLKAGLPAPFPGLQ